MVECSLILRQVMTSTLGPVKSLLQYKVKHTKQQLHTRKDNGKHTTAVYIAYTRCCMGQLLSPDMPVSYCNIKRYTMLFFRGVLGALFIPTDPVRGPVRLIV